MTPPTHHTCPQCGASVPLATRKHVTDRLLGADADICDAERKARLAGETELADGLLRASELLRWWRGR